MSKDIKSRKKVTIEFEAKTFWKAGTIIFALLFIMSIFTGGFKGSSETNDAVVPSLRAPSPTQGQGPQAAPPSVINVETPSDSIFKGDENAPVTVVEFSDFQCPFCQRFYQQTLPQIEKEYIETGKVKFVYRHLPLAFHPFAQKAGEASECANDQGKFWEYHDVIFDNQAALSDTIFSQWAQQIGLDENKFNKCLDSGKYTDKVKRDNADAAKYGASGTPTFFINGKILVGAQPFAAFKTIIDAELA